MKKAEPRQISVFIASPGDLAPERKIFKDTIDTLNAGFADGAGVKFVPMGWEDVLAETGRRTQGVINQEIDQCDLFILSLNRRWGQDAPDSKFSSYTEEEFHLAFSLWKKRKSPEVLVFFKTVDSASVADPGPELKKVLDFRKNLESSYAILIRTFNTDVDFGNEIDRHLRAFARGEWNNLADHRLRVVLPKAQVAALSKAEDAGARRVKRVEGRSSSTKAKAVKAKADLSLVKAHQTDLTFARAAVDAANGGRNQDARVLFAKATEGTTDLSILSVAAEFFRQIGDPDNASRLVQRQAAIGRDRTIAARHYLALVPPGYLSGIGEQLLAPLLAAYPEDVAEEIRSIYEEAFGGGKLESMVLEMMVKHFTEAEIVQLARFLASPVGQSSLQKQQGMVLEMMQFAQREFERILLKRHPELAGEAAQRALPAPGEPNRLAGDTDTKDFAAGQVRGRSDKVE